MVALWLDIVVFTVVFTSEVALIVEVWHVVLQLPVALLEVSIWVMLISMDQLSHVWLLMLMSVLIWSLLVVNMSLEIFKGIVLSTLLLGRRLGLLGWLGLLCRLLLLLLLRLLGLLLVVHLFVEVGCLGAQVLLSLCLGLWWLRVVIWVLHVIWIIVVMMRVLRDVLVSIWLVPLCDHWVVFKARHLSVRVSMSRIGIVIGITSGVWVMNGSREVSSDIWVHSSIFRVAVRILGIWLLVVCLSLHMAIMLLRANIEVLVRLLALLALLHGVFWGWLSSDRLNSSGLKGMHAMALLGMIRLHLEHQVAVLDVGLRGAEGSCVSIEGCVVRLVPPAGIEGVEVVPPVEVERLGLIVVGVCLNVVIHDIPGHILGVKALTPRLKRWRPEVHHDRLRFRRQLDGRIARDTAHLLVVNRVGNEIGRPLDLIDVPVIAWVKALLVVVAFPLGVAVAIDHVHAEGVLLD